MPTHQTDCREYPRGQFPGDWTERWRSTLSRVEGATCDLPHRSHIRVVGPSGGGRAALSWNAPDGDAGQANQEILVRFLWEAGDNRPFIVARGSGAATTEGGSVLVLSTSTTTQTIGFFSGGGYAPIGTFTYALKLGAWAWARYRFNGTSVSVRMWNDGDAEPGAWSLTVTDGANTTGWIGLAASDATDVFRVPFVSVATNGGTALGESSLPRPMDVWSQDPTAQIAFTAEWPHYNPATDEIERKWTVTPNYTLATGPSDYPPNQPFLLILKDPGSVGMRLEGDVEFAGLELRTAQSITLDNTPGGGGQGPADDWVDRSFAGFPVIVRAGEVGQPHRAFEVVYPSVVNKEPDVGPDTVTATVNPAGAVLDETLEVRRYLGIPTAPMMLTNTGKVTAPYIAAYDVTSFLVFGWFIIPAATPQFQVLALKELSGTNRNIGVFMVPGPDPNEGKIFVQVSIGGATTTFHLSPEAYDDGVRHSFAWGLRDEAESYLLVDDEVVSEFTPPGSVDTQAAPFVWGALMASQGMEFGVGLVGEFRTPDQARSLLAARLTGEEPGVEGYWPGDDLTGAIMTDYSPNANHGTLAGTDGIDYLRSPTDAGMPEQAGRPMPLTLGVAYNARAELQDSIRNRFRTNDRDNPAGTDLAVKARGLLITGGGADYTDVGDGVVDMATPQSEPVTFDLDPVAGAEAQSLHVPRVVGDAIALRRRLGPDRIDADAFAALRQLLPYRGGAAYREPPTVAALMKLLGALGAHGRLDRDARQACGALLPPLNPGPYGQGSLLELLGFPNRGVTFYQGNASGMFDLKPTTNTSYTLAAYIWIGGSVKDASVSSSFTYFPGGSTIVDRCGASATGYYLGIDGRDGFLIWGQPGVIGATSGLHYLKLPAKLKPWTWYAVVGNVDESANTRELHAVESGAFGAAVSESITGASVMANAVEPFRVGHGPRGGFAGGIHAVVGSAAKWLGGELIGYSITKPSIGSTVYPPWWFANLDEGAGDSSVAYINSVGGATVEGRIEGAAWRPRLVLDFRATATQEFSGLRRFRPVWRADARYKLNTSPVTGADVSSGVSTADRVALGAPFLSQPDSDRDIRDDYRQARELALETPLAASDAALETASRVRTRFDPEARSGEAKRWWHAALRLMLTDEVRVFHDRWGLDVGRDMRVHSLVHALANQGEEEGPHTDIGAWS